MKKRRGLQIIECACAVPPIGILTLEGGAVWEPSLAMAECQVPVPLNAALFSQVLSKEPHWYNLCTCLGAEQAELTVIESNHRTDVKRCYIEVYNCLQASGKCLSWDDIVTALKGMSRNDLAKEIQSQYMQQYQRVSRLLVHHPLEMLT